jgi:hypothetical protein
LCSPLNPSLIDATGAVTDQYIAERKLSQLQAEMQQQIPAGQIGVLMQPPPRPVDQNRSPDSKFPVYPRQPQVPAMAINQNSVNSVTHTEPAKLNLPNERLSRDGMLSYLRTIMKNIWDFNPPSPKNYISTLIV